MRSMVSGIAVLTVTAGAAAAGGLDRTGQPIGIIFEDGNYAEFSMGRADPEITGNDVASLNPAETPTGDVGLGFNQLASGLKMDLNDQLSFSLIYEQPWGSDVSYPVANADPTTPGSFLLGGTEAISNSESFTGILRYKFDNNFSVHGGVRWQQVDGEISLQGAAYNSPATPGLDLDGYNVVVEQDGAFGWVAGAAYEIPDIAARIALTYQSEVEHEFTTVESLPDIPGVTFTGTTKTKTPQSVNLDFQSGVAENTLVFGSIRWADHSVTKLRPTTADVDLIDISDSITYNLGVAQRLNERWAVSLSFGYEAEDSDNLVSPLSPTNGFQSVGVGVQYTGDGYKVTGGVRYTKVGDAFAETGTPDTARAGFEDNDVVSFGVRVGFYF